MKAPWHSSKSALPASRPGCGGVTAGRITKFAPDGRIAGIFPLPTPAPTMPCFGSSDLKALFIKSLRTDRPNAALREGGRRRNSDGRFRLRGCAERSAFRPRHRPDRR
ncbi:SMP-30/gluconolactonase/LRE family protein [Mesorhizobium sp. B2-4-6]|nr:SMP-30/gluconolactonase/LRE family protein [Mesorhizobium sp. B2-4-6]